MKYFQQTHINIDNTKTQPSLALVLCMFATILLLGTFSQHTQSTGKIVKWKDDKGVTHYGDSVPAQYSGRESSEISKQGITIKRNTPIDIQAQALDTAKLEQVKKDKALTNAFTNANEIDLARDRNLQLDLVAIEGLQLQKKNTLNRLAVSQSYAKNFTKNNKPIPADLSAEIKSNQALLAKQEQQIEQRRTSMESTRQRFDEDKARFITLKKHNE
jgi:hypothetical protein